MKLVVMIPCRDEEVDLASVLTNIPKTIPGISCIETLLLDDGSTDRSVQVAKSNGITYIHSNGQRLGLAKTFKVGLLKSLYYGADIIVNIDGDGQYDPKDIAKLVAPIIEGKADFVVGNRQITSLQHLSDFSKFLQTLGSRVVSYFAGVSVTDVPSGFRAINRFAATRLNIFSSYTYTIETILQAANTGLVIRSVDIAARETKRKSRLVKNKADYIIRSIVTIFRMFTMYNPMRVFMTASIFFLAFSLLLAVVYFASGRNFTTHGEALIFSFVFLILGFIVAIGGVLADLSHYNRTLLEEISQNFRNTNKQSDQASSQKGVVSK